VTTISRAKLFITLPPEPMLAPRPTAHKVMVLDDDPTGTQTVYGVAVVTEWSLPSLEAELRDASPCCYILTNTRAFPPERARAINQEIGQALARASRSTGRSVAVISRSDSTLRGHFPVETDALATALGVSFDGTLLIPAFFDGGRFTIDDVHYVAEGANLTPAGETEFAQDASFGYRASNLREWVAEKTAGRVSAGEVASISIHDLRIGGVRAVASKLLALASGSVVVVNAAARGDLAVLTQALSETEQAGRRYLFRTAADFVAAYAGIEPRAWLTKAEMQFSQVAAGGLVVVGSYVGKTSAQLNVLLGHDPQLEPVEVQVSRLLRPGSRPAEIHRCERAVNDGLARGKSVALFTSRRLLTGRTSQENLAIGETISASLVTIVRALSTPPRWLVAKGGITASEIATKALGIRRAMVLGQIARGVPVWRAGEESRFPGLPYVVFPGNVGEPDTLRKVITLLGP